MLINPYIYKSDFSPLSFGADLVSWHDASVTSSITGTTNVTEWRDLSGNNRHINQTMSGLSSGTTTLNGKNVINFQDYSSRGKSVTNHIAYGSPLSIFFVCKPRDADNGDVICSSTNIGNENTFLYMNYNTAQLWTRVHFWRPTILYVYDTTRVSITTPQIFGIVTSNTQIYDYRGDTGIGGPYTFGGTPSTAAAQALQIGSRTGTNANVVTYMAEIFVVNRQLTTNEISQVGAYLSAKWGVPWTI